jgi:nitroreductase
LDASKFDAYNDGMNPITPNSLIDALQWRYAVKKFDSARIIPDSIYKILEDSLVLSASSFGLQPYKFLNISDPAIRAKLLPASWSQPQVVDASHFILFAIRTDINQAYISRFLARIAQVRKVPVESLESYKQLMVGGLLSGKTDLPNWAAKQAYIALGNLLASAALLGVDACPMEGIDPAQYNQILNLPAKNLSATVACALGYRHPDDKYAQAPKVRFPKEELIEKI